METRLVSIKMSEDTEVLELEVNGQTFVQRDIVRVIPLDADMHILNDDVYFNAENFRLLLRDGSQVDILFDMLDNDVYQLLLDGIETM